MNFEPFYFFLNLVLLSIDLQKKKGYQNEEAVALAIRETGLKRSELFITTKYGGGNIENAIRTSLNKVRTYLLLTFFHHLDRILFQYLIYF